MDNKVIKVLNKEHGAKVIAYWKSLGVNTRNYIGTANLVDFGDTYIYYGVINGHFSNYNLQNIKSANAKILELPTQKLEEMNYKITPEQAQSIIDIACPTWKTTLAKKWAIQIVKKEEIEVLKEFYKEMRCACDTNQHKVFDSIFGAEEKFKKGDWVITTTEADDSLVLHKKGEVFQVMKVGAGLVYVRPYDAVEIKRVRLATPEEIEKAQWYPDGTPCLVSGSDKKGWELRYATGEGRFYDYGAKTDKVSSSVWNHHMKLDINNLPVTQ